MRPLLLGWKGKSWRVVFGIALVLGGSGVVTASGLRLCWSTGCFF